MIADSITVVLSRAGDLALSHSESECMATEFLQDAIPVLEACCDDQDLVGVLAEATTAFELGAAVTSLKHVAESLQSTGLLQLLKNR